MDSSLDPYNASEMQSDTVHQMAVQFMRQIWLLPDSEAEHAASGPADDDDWEDEPSGEDIDDDDDSLDEGRKIIERLASDERRPALLEIAREDSQLPRVPGADIANNDEPDSAENNPWFFKRR